MNVRNYLTRLFNVLVLIESTGFVSPDINKFEDVVYCIISKQALCYSVCVCDESIKIHFGVSITLS